MTYVARRVGPSTAVAELGSMSTSLRERPPPRPLAPRLPREGRRRSLTRRLSERPRRPDSLDPEAKDRVRQRPGQRQGKTRTGTANRGDQAGAGETRTETGQDRTDQDRDRTDQGRARTANRGDQAGTETGQTRTDRTDRTDQDRNRGDRVRDETSNRREKRVRSDGLGRYLRLGVAPRVLKFGA